MTKKARNIKIIAISLCAALLLVTGMAYGLFAISKSRTFQFFGELIPRVEAKEKVIALTFDDGPTPQTRDVLAILRQKDVKATFFVTGEGLQAHPDIGKEIASAGHDLGNHTYSHQRMVLKSSSFIADQIETTSQLIRQTGFDGNINFRPPYGKKLFALPWYLRQHDIKTVTWDVEPETYGSSADFLVSHTLEKTRPGSIFLLHPFCQACGPQLEAIGRIIDELKAQGYRFITVNELLRYR